MYFFSQKVRVEEESSHEPIITGHFDEPYKELFLFKFVICIPQIVEI